MTVIRYSLLMTEGNSEKVERLKKWDWERFERWRDSTWWNLTKWTILQGLLCLNNSNNVLHKGQGTLLEVQVRMERRMVDLRSIRNEARKRWSRSRNNVLKSYKRWGSWITWWCTRYWRVIGSRRSTVNVWEERKEKEKGRIEEERWRGLFRTNLKWFECQRYSRVNLEMHLNLHRE